MKLHVAALLALPALALPAELEARGTMWFSCDTHNVPDNTHCNALFAWLRLRGNDNLGYAPWCIEKCCVSWSGDCGATASEIVWRAEKIRDMCGAGKSGVFQNARGCFGSMCLSNRYTGCGDAPRVWEPW
jgi:hypothetical protein